MPAGMTTPLSSNGLKKLVLNAGAFLVGFDPSSYTDANGLRTAIASYLTDSTKCLGITRGGGSFQVAREMRQVEADGIRYRFVGDTFVDSADAQLATTLICLADPNVMKHALGTGVATTSTYKTVLKMATRIEVTDYMQHLCWVGDTVESGFVLIHFANALNTADINITITDKGELTLPVEFHAFQGTVDDYDYAPFEIIYLNEVEAPGISLYPAATTVEVGSTVTLNITKNPSNLTVTFASDDDDKATVGESTGVVTGVAAGTVTITASATSGTDTVTSTAVVVVKPASTD